MGWEAMGEEGCRCFTKMFPETYLPRGSPPVGGIKVNFPVRLSLSLGLYSNKSRFEYKSAHFMQSFLFCLDLISIQHMITFQISELCNRAF